jgi:hypothetical protein
VKLEDLLECSADRLEALNDQELEAILLPYFPKTRPEMVARSEPKRAEVKPLSAAEQEKLKRRQRAEQLVAQFGIKLVK